MLFWKGPIVKSFSRRRHSQPYVQAEALVDARNKVFNVIMAVLLVFTMLPITAFTYESQASAETLDSSGTTQVSEYSDDSSNSSGGSTSDSSATTSSGSSDGESSSPENADGGYPSTAVDPSDDNTQNGDTQNGSDGQNSPNDQGTSDEGAGASGQDDQGGLSGAPSDGENNSEENSQNDSSASDESADEPEKQRDPLAWQFQLDTTKLDASIAIETDKIEALENNQLPAEIPATLRVSFELTPGEDGLLKDDWIETILPSFLSFENASLEVFRLNADGTETTEKIANVEIKDGVLKITFIDAAATEDTSVTVRGYVDIEASLASSLLGEEESEQLWIAQTGEDGTQREVKLLLPTYQSVLDTWNEAHSPLGMLGGALGITDGEVVAQDETSNDSSETETTIAAGPFNTQIFSQTIWCDNNYGNRPTPESLEAGYIPQYSLNGTFYNLVEVVNGDTRVTDQAKSDLHLSDADVARIESSDLIQITQSSVNTYDVTTASLPSEVLTTEKSPRLDDNGDYVYDEQTGEQLFDSKITARQSITWRLADNNVYEGNGYNYLPGSSSKWNLQYKMLATDISFNVVGKIGNNGLKTTFEGHPEHFAFVATINGQEAGRITVADAVGEWLTITDTTGGCTITGTVPQYDEKGYPIVYYVEYTGPNFGEDYYQASYDNSASPSHGSAAGAVYDGGTMTLRHAGTTTFTGTKVWLDNGATANRPAVTYTLWRYSTEGSPETASQVSVASLQSENPDAPATNATGFISLEVPAGSGNIDFYQLLVSEYSSALINSLPKYDPDGYPYIYCMREDAISGYEQVFGTVQEDGSVSDTLPRYENESGDGWIEVSRESRPANDHFVYNGGTLSNRITGTTETQITKTWSIAAFQDSLQDVVCTFQAQSRTVNPLDGDDWTNVTEEGTQTLSNWNAETLTKTVEQSFPKYDSHGNELGYRWIETGVSFGDQDTGFIANADGTASFTIEVTNSEGGTEELAFTSTPTTEKNDDGSYSTTIENTFENVTDQHVDKYWEQADGSLAQIAPSPDYSDGNATVELYQDGQLIGTYTMDGVTDSNSTAIDNLSGATWQETRSYHIDFEGLPKYSPEGKRYTYLVLETSKEGWTTERTYDPETRTTRIDNYFPEGEGSEIRVTKSWIDGDDAEHRYTVRVNLVANHDMHSQGKNPDGSYVTEYQAGQVVATVDLTESDLWFAEVDIPIGGLSYQDFTAVEVGLVASDNGTPDDMSDDTVYNALTKEEAAQNPDYADESWVNAGWTNPENRRVATPEHVYEVRSTENDTLDSCEVTNRRLGLFDLTIDKTWNDALGNDPDGIRPGAVLTLSCDEYPEAFSLDTDGNLQVSVSANTLPVTITDDEGNPVRATIVNANGEPAERGNARIEIDTTKSTSSYEFSGMPKYDANGMNVHYSVNESWTEDSGDYSSTETVGEYVVEEGMRHFQDHQTIEYSNSRSGTRDVVFYKQWHDNYVSQELNQRPDIYLTLYRMSANQTTPEAVPGYIHFSWSAIAEEIGAANEQMVTISGLSKYDSQGAEYVYYASETMSADGTSLGYGDVQFDYGSINAADQEADDTNGGSTVIESADDAVKIDQGAEGNDPQQNGTGWAIREDGTFVNRLDADLVAQGTKLWENIPGNVSQKDLPAVTIYLQQKLASDDAWPEAYATQNSDGTWKVSGTVASTDQLVMDANNQYSYTITTGDDGNALPRFDDEGNRYEYRALEVVWGLLDQPGGFTANDIQGVNLSEVRDGNSSTDLTGAVYVIEHGETGSFLLRNIYGGNETGNLTVKKLFDGRDQGDAYPDVTFEVYRYYQGYEGVEDAQSPVELVASHTISASEFAAGGDGGNNSASYTFEDLDIYAPDGSRWIYFVTEHTINGYTTTVAAADIRDAHDTQLVAGNLVDASGNVVQTGGVAMRSTDLGNADNSVIADDINVDVTFANTYAPGSVNLSGRKVWYDSNNIFSVRPEAPLNLTFERTAGDITEKITTQSTNSASSNYLNWTQKNETGDWIFTLSNIEQWAPNGQVWEYTVTETLPDGADQYYLIVTGTSSATAGTSDEFRLENALSGRATVIKNWNDGDDPYGLRPSSVTMQLQARYKQQDGGTWSEWDNAYTVWSRFATEAELSENGLTNESTRLVLSDTSNWRGFWNHLPVLARLTTDSELNEIEYRVVEVAIGNQGISSSVNNDTGDTDNGVYDTVTPYQPAQDNWDGSAQNGWTTTVSNTLQDMAISATKTWDDQENAWDTRPDGEGSNEWSVTYFLQRSTDGANWQWVVADGSGVDPDGSATQNGVVSRTITGTGDSAAATWDYLPQYDTSGNKYQYRVVEQVPGSYDVKDGTQVSDTDTAHRYYVVSTTAGTGGVSSAQSFTNNLRTVDLTGTKQWEDFGSGLTPEFDENDLPEMTLWRAAKNASGGFGQAERVLKNGNPAPQPTWTDNGNGTWTFTYSDLPAANANDQDYVYWAVESAGSGNTDGFYPVYGVGDNQSSSSHGGSGTVIQESGSADGDDLQTNEIITNTATKLSLDKISNWVNDDTLTNIELSIQSRDGGTTYAVWSNGADGKTYNTYTWVNGTTNPADTASAIHRADNFIVGLKAGDYTLVETGDVPDGYAIAPEVDFQINADGTATFEGSNHDDEDTTTNVQDVVVKTENGVHTILLTAEDPVLRGHLQLTKYVSDDGTAGGDNRKALQGATFSLYHKHFTEPIATGLTSDDNGLVATNLGANGNIWLSEEFQKAHDYKYGQLRDGLPEGTYYFVETSTTSGAVLPSGDAAKSPTLTITQDNHYDYTEQVVSGTMENEKFNATVILHKYDTADNAGIEGINFTLSYTSEGSTTASSRTVTTGAGGELKLENLEKGSYVLTEQSNTGYANSGFGASFTIGNEDDDQTFDIKSVSDGAGIDFKVTSGEGTYTDGTGIPNVRSEGQVTLNKRGNSTAINATFDLQMKTGDGSWSTVVIGLETANRYELTWDKDGLTATAADAGDEKLGVLVVTGLTWNTYRFVETATAPGYLPDNADGDITSSEFTIGRTTQNMATSVTVQNNQTELRINKQSPTGEILNGAKFTVTPVGDSTFADPTVLGSAYQNGVITLTTADTGIATLKGQLVVGGTYEIYEVAGPSGYNPIDAKFRVYVENDGYLTVVDDQGKEVQLPDGYKRTNIDGTGTEAFSFVATNEPMAIKLTKTSAAENHLYLEGAEFRLTGQVMNDGNTAHTYTTNKDGIIEITDGLMGGVKYTLTENVVPAGYIAMDSLYFKMDDRGEIVVTDIDGNPLDQEDWPAGWGVKDDKISFTAADEPTRLTIEKVDGDNNEKKLSGAEFSVTPVEGSKFANGSTKTKVLTTDEEGTDSLVADLVVGSSYTIEETKAPDGYTKIDRSMTITVQENGSICIAEGTTAPSQFVISDDGTVQVFAGTVTNDPTELTLNKIDSTTNQALAGAKFELTGKFANGSTSQTLDAATDSTVQLDKALLIADGKTQYTLTETGSPGGYECIQQSLVFTVSEAGVITPVDASAAQAAGWSVGKDGISVTAADKPIEIDLVKLGTDSGTKELTGSEFLVKPVEGSSFANASKEENENGIVVTPENIGTKLDIKLKVGNAYTIEETLAPTGYETIIGTLTFAINDDGTLVKESGSDAWTISENGGVAVITATDKPIEVVLAKTSSANEQLALTGAVFELYRGASAAEGDFVEQVSTGTDGTIALENHVGGETYTLREVTAPAGYELLPDVTFTVKTDGTVTLSENAPAGYTVTEGEDGVVTFTAADTPIEAQLVKTDEAGTPLAGAVFIIQGTFAGDYAQAQEITLDPTDEDGITSIPVAALIANETYTIAELTAPDGYERAGSVKFTVATNGTITILSDDANAASISNNTATGDTNTASGGNNEITNNGGVSAVAGTNGTGTFAASSEGTMAVITATNHPVEITITKTDGAQGLLPGAEFTATSTDGTADGAGVHSVTAVTGEDGVAVLSGLIAGKEYTLTETKAPAGYELLTDTLTFTVQPDGTIDAGLLPPAAFSIGVTKDAVSVTDSPLEVSLVKQAPNGAPLAGAEFTVEGDFPDGQTSKTFTSDESGIVFNQLQLTGSAEGTRYSVTETKAPDGYAQPEGSLDLLVYEDGSVQIAESSSADMKQYASVAFTSGTAVVTLNNEPLPGTELPQTGDRRIMPLLAGAFGLLGLWALVMGGIAYRRFRDIKK